MNFDKYITNVPDFPLPGIQFKDITTLIQDGDAFSEAINEMAEFAKSVGANMIMGPESRGFIFGCPVAVKLGIGFVPLRKPGKLPRETITESYDLEYGTNSLEIHKDSLKPGDKVVIIDDILATGGTILAGIKLAERLGAKVVGVCELIELTKLNGKDKFKDIPLKTLIKYDID